MKKIREKKVSVSLNVRIQESINDRLEQYCEDSGQSKTVAVERALIHFIDDYYDKHRI